MVGAVKDAICAGASEKRAAFRERDIVSMSATDTALENWITHTLERAHKTHTPGKQAHSAAEPRLSETDRMIAVIEAATAAYDPNDPKKVETLFAGQTVALDVIFNQFIRRELCLFDSMRVALRAQAQCRSTFKSLHDFNNPRLRASARISKISSEQTIENAESRG